MNRKRISNWIKLGLIPIVLVGIVAVISLSVYPINCAIIGEDWCNFSEAETLFQYPTALSEVERYQKLISHCLMISNGAKRNKCYYFGATISDGANMITACNHVIDNWGKSIEECINNHGYRSR